jgi:RNA polymerase sigma-70 factor (ECF subfamily)
VIRRRRLDARLAAEAHTEVPHPDPAHRLGADDLLGRLSEERRTAFVLTQVIGLSYAEAAEVESVPVGTIRSRVARARDELVSAVARARAS